MFLRDGDDLHLKVNVPMADAALGTEVTVDDLVGEPISIAVDAGTQPSEEIRLEGKGMPHLRGEGNGDLVAHVNVTIPTKLDRRSQELLEQLRDHRDDSSSVADESSSRSFFSRFRRR